MADNLESFFKKHLSDESAGEDDWNVPSDSVWENTFPEIQKKKGVFVPWKYLYLLGLISIIGFALVLFFWDFQDTNSTPITNNSEFAIKNTDQNQSPNTITSSDNNSDENPSQSEIIENNRINAESLETGNNITISSNNNIIENKYPGKIDKKYIADIEVSTTDENKTIDPKDLALKENKNQNLHSGVKVFETDTDNEIKEASSILESVNTALAESEVASPSQEVISSVNLASVADSINKQPPDNNSEMLPETVFNDQLSELNSEDLYGPTNESEKNIEPFNYKGKIGVGVYYAQAMNSTYLRGEMISGITNTTPVFLYSGNYGLDIKYYISNKLAIVSGIGRSEIKSWSKSLVDFGYDTSTEHDMGNGEKENTSEVPMPSPFGEINTEITYRFSDSDEIPDGELMQSEIETHQNVQYLLIPLGVEYNILNRHKITWFAEGGFGYNHALKDATEISSRIIHYGDDMTVVGEEMTNHPSYKDFYISYYIGTGLNYRLSNALNFNTSVRYIGNLTDLNMQKNMSTNVHVISLKLGLVYYF